MPSIQTLPFVPDFEPDFAYDIRMADYTPRRDNAFAARRLAASDVFPDIAMPVGAGHWPALPPHLCQGNAVSLRDLAAHKPLVISLYAPEWGEYGSRHWRLLMRAGRQISSLGGQLLVAATLPPDALADLVRQRGVSFAVVHDTDHHLAERLGAYAAADPVWQRVAGLDADVPVPATVVVGRRGYVSHAFYSPDIDGMPQVRTLLEAVCETSSVRQSA